MQQNITNVNPSKGHRDHSIHIERARVRSNTRGLYYKTLQIRNLQKNCQILPQASAFLLSVTNTLVLTNTLAYYGICRLQIRNVFIVQAPALLYYIMGFQDL